VVLEDALSSHMRRKMGPLRRARFATLEKSWHAGLDLRIKRPGLRTLHQRPNKTRFAVGRSQIVIAFQIRIKLQTVRRPRTRRWCSHFRGCRMRFHVQSPKSELKGLSFNEGTQVCSNSENSDNTTSLQARRRKVAYFCFQDSVLSTRNPRVVRGKALAAGLGRHRRQPRLLTIAPFI
jgi:hypothetical protein